MCSHQLSLISKTWVDIILRLSHVMFAIAIFSYRDSLRADSGYGVSIFDAWIGSEG